MHHLYLLLLLAIAAISWSMFDLQFNGEGSVPWREQAMVHKRMPEPIWMASSDRLGTIYHLLFTRDGDCAMDCEL